MCSAMRRELGVDERQGTRLERGHGSLVAESFEAWPREDGRYTEASLVNSVLQFVRVFCDFRSQVIISKRGHWRKIAPESTAESSHPAVFSPASPALRGRGSDGAILAPNIPGRPRLKSNRTCSSCCEFSLFSFCSVWRGSES